MNLGNIHECSMRELAETVISLTGSKSKIVEKPLPCDDPVQRRPDLSYAQQTIGWNPSVTLGEGLEKTINYFNQIKGNVGCKSGTDRKSIVYQNLAVDA